MENSNYQELREWVEQQTAALETPAGWNSDTAAALARFRARVAAEGAPAPRRWPVWAAAAAVVIAALLAWPAGRVLAQQFWQFLTVPKVAVVSVRSWPAGVPSPQVKLIGTPIPPIPARDLEEARWRVHYDPRLPQPGVLASAPRLSTTFPLSAGTMVKVADLELALRKAGIADQRVPPEWNGAQLALHTSAIVIAEWPEVAMVQSLPLTLTAPAGFDFAAFSALVLHVVGVAPEEARRIAERTNTAPPWLVPFTRDFDATASLEEITLNSGLATLLQQRGRDGRVDRTTLLWSAPDRVYVLDGQLDRELMIAVANAVR